MRRAFIVTTAAILTAAVPAPAGVPVIDYSNLFQNTTTALKTVAMAAKQVEQYNLQLQQYANEIKQATGLADVARVYQQYQQTMQSLQSLYGQFANGGSLQNYLNQFQNVNYWAQVPPSNYPAAANASWNQNSQTQKQQNDNWAQAIAQHQQLLQNDAARLQAAQQSASGADGELAAIQASAQINAAIANELMEIHALLVQQQQALQARQASQANDEAMRQAASQQFLQWNYQPSQEISYKP
jgi:P-type conjugative transfer protein TrbJ